MLVEKLPREALNCTYLSITLFTLRVEHPSTRYQNSEQSMHGSIKNNVCIVECEESIL